MKKLTKLKLKTISIASTNELFPPLENKKFLKIHEDPKKEGASELHEKKALKLVDFKSLLPKPQKENLVKKRKK